MGAVADAGAHKWQEVQQRRSEAADARTARRLELEAAKAKRLEAGQVGDGGGGDGDGDSDGGVGGGGGGGDGGGSRNGRVGGPFVEGAGPEMGVGAVRGEGRPAWEADGGTYGGTHTGTHTSTHTGTHTGTGSSGHAQPAWRALRLSVKEEAGGKLAYSSWGKRKGKGKVAPAPAPDSDSDLVYNVAMEQGQGQGQGAAEVTPVSALGARPAAGVGPSEERDDGDVGAPRGPRGEF